MSCFVVRIQKDPNVGEDPGVAEENPAIYALVVPCNDSAEEHDRWISPPTTVESGNLFTCDRGLG